MDFHSTWRAAGVEPEQVNGVCRRQCVHGGLLWAFLGIVAIVQTVVMLLFCDNESYASMNRLEMPLSYGVEGLIELEISAYCIKACFVIQAPQQAT